jgi:hypothetical protein
MDQFVVDSLVHLAAAQTLWCVRSCLRSLDLATSRKVHLLTLFEQINSLDCCTSTQLLPPWHHQQECWCQDHVVRHGSRQASLAHGQQLIGG